MLTFGLTEKKLLKTQLKILSFNNRLTVTKCHTSVLCGVAYFDPDPVKGCGSGNWIRILNGRYEYIGGGH